MKGKILLIVSAAVVAIIVSAIITANRGTTDMVASNIKLVAPPVSKTVPLTEVPEKSLSGVALAQPVQTAKAVAADQPAMSPETAQADQPLKINGYVVQDPEARMALSFVGTDPEAEAYCSGAINDPNLPSEERKDLIEDLNEDGLMDSQHPTAPDMPVIANRIQLIEQMAPQAMDGVNAAAFAEAYKDLVNLYNGIPPN